MANIFRRPSCCPATVAGLMLVAVATLQGFGGARAQERALDCPALARLQIAGVRVTDAVDVEAPAGPLTVPHCRVTGVIDTETRFAALLPKTWNRRFVAGGSGGFAGAVANQAQAALNDGYATIGTDAGHQGTGTDARWARGNDERQINYGHLAIHRTAEVAKGIIEAYYGSAPRYSYFFGCSNGGRQGLMEVQRFAADFDGVVSCAPALDFTNISAAFVRNTRLVFPDPNAPSLVTTENLKLVESKVLDACDARDGVTDGVLDDPRSCRFDVATLPACPNEQPSASCVTTAQRRAIAGIYAPTVIGGKTVYAGQPLGNESGWLGWITSASGPSLQRTFGREFYANFIVGRDDWDYRTYDLSRWKKDTEKAAAILNADNPDITAFKARGGKLILAHGWSDPALNPLSTVAYYERLQKRDARVRDYSRLFMMPGVLHCAGGPGPDSVDWLKTIAEWVENGRAPDRVIARKIGKDGAVVNARPLCPYPQRAVHDGKGSVTDATSYVCRAR